MTPHAPIDPYRAHTYLPTEIYAGLLDGGYLTTPDARAYAWSKENPRDAFITLLRAIHDHSMTDAIDELLQEHDDVVGVMGGHALERGTPAYADAAVMAHDLATSGLTVLTGGGPGAMEAANLGAACRGRAALEEALTALAAVATFTPSIDAWASLAWEVRDSLVEPGTSFEPVATRPRSVGVPTWFYGHEPPNLFAERIAKYFSNALREDLLIARCNRGIVVLPGAAGTVQEIFQAMTPLYYAPDDADLPPLVLVGREHWGRKVPVWSAIQGLAAGRSMASAVHLVDTPAEAANLLRATPA